MSAPAQPPVPPFVAVWTSLGRLVAQFLAEHAYVEIKLSLKDGKIMPVHITRAFLPENLPKV